MRRFSLGKSAKFRTGRAIFFYAAKLELSIQMNYHIPILHIEFDGDDIQLLKFFEWFLIHLQATITLDNYTPIKIKYICDVCNFLIWKYILASWKCISSIRQLYYVEYMLANISHFYEKNICKIYFIHFDIYLTY